MTSEKERKRLRVKYEKQLEHNKRKEAKIECRRCNEVKKLVNQHNLTLSAHAIVRAIRKVLEYKY